MARWPRPNQYFRRIADAGQQQHPERNGEWNPEEHPIEPAPDKQDQQRSHKQIAFPVGVVQSPDHQYEEQTHRWDSHAGRQC